MDPLAVVCQLIARRPIVAVAHTFTDSLELILKNCGVVFVARPQVGRAAAATPAELGERALRSAADERARESLELVGAAVAVAIAAAAAAEADVAAVK